MIDIMVVRGAGDIQGDDIVNPLITDSSVAINRGRAEINRNELSSKVDMVTVYRTGVRTGQTSETFDAIYGETWRGKIVSIGHSFTKLSKTTTLALHKYVK